MCEAEIEYHRRFILLALHLVMLARRIQIALLGLVFGVAGCSGSRSTLPPVALPDGLSPSEEKIWTMSAYEAERLRRTGLVYADPVLGTYVQRLGERLVPERHNVPTDFRFHVVMDPEANAFALPDGNIYIHLGLLALLQREAQLAQVLSHEIRHVTGRHSVIGYEQHREVAGATQVLSLAAAIGFGVAGGPMAQFWSGVSQLGLALTANASINGHGRAAEEESDRHAVEALHESGYDPCAAIEVFEILLAEHGEAPAVATFFYGSHPQLTRRMAYTRDQAEALRGEPLACDTAPRDSAYLVRTALVRSKQVELWVRNERYDRAIATAQRSLVSDSSSAELRFWLAEALRQGSDDPATQQRAREEYWAAADLDTTYAAPFRGLGAMAEAEGDTTAAVEAYEYYLHLNAEANDRRYIRRRIEELSTPADSLSN